MRTQAKLLSTLLSSILFYACIGMSSNTGVKRIAADETYDLTGEWNDTDSQQIASTMVDSVLSGGWLERWEESEPPVVIVGNVRNNTSEHIDTPLFVKDLEAELINSGQVTFVASSTERSQIRGEREDQQSNASEETMKRIAQETGADFMLIGSINSKVEETPGQKIIYYLVSMELINIESNIKAWVGTERIKKLINKSAQLRRNTTERFNNDW